jgi:phosphohistidine phosphatase SixA
MRTINLYLIRHTNSCGNVLSLTNFKYLKNEKKVDHTLSKIGVKQAQISGEFLSNFLSKNKIEIDKVIVSSRKRTSDTFYIHKDFIKKNLLNKNKKQIKLKRYLNPILYKYDIDNFFGIIKNMISNNNYKNLLFYTHKGFIREMFNYVNTNNNSKIENNNIYKLTIKLDEKLNIIKIKINLIKDFTKLFDKQIFDLDNSLNKCIKNYT